MSRTHILIFVLARQEEEVGGGDRIRKEGDEEEEVCARNCSPPYAWELIKRY